MTYAIPNNQKLSGSDYFHLLLDRFMLQQGLVGNISRIHLHLEPEADLQKIHGDLENNKVLALVNELKVKLRWPRLPIWVKTERNSKHAPVAVHQKIDKNTFDQSILNRKVDNDNGLVYIDLCSLEDGSKHMVISMHHVLFDHKGMMNFVMALNEPDTKIQLFPKAEKIPFLKQFWNFVTCTIFVLRSGSSELGTLVKKDVKPGAAPKFKILRFTEEETKQIEVNAWNHGARLGRSSFYMAVVTRMIHQTLLNRGEKPPFMWFSIPQNQRRKGAVGHLISNQLSFLFLKLMTNELKDTKTTVSSINDQLKTQIAAKLPSRYRVLLDVFRWIPMPVFGAMVNLSTSGSVSSFSFSDLGENSMLQSNFRGYKVNEMFSYPPVPSPPGLNIVVMKEHGQLKLVWSYFDEVIDQTEVDAMEADLRTKLLETT